MRVTLRADSVDSSLSTSPGRAPLRRPLSSLGTAVQRRAAKRQLVSVGVAVDRLADAVGVRFDLVRLQSPRGDRGQVRIEIVNEDRGDRRPCATRVLDYVQRPMFGKGPHRLRGVGEERRLAQQLLVPRTGRIEVPHTQTREEVQGHRHESRQPPALEPERRRSHLPPRPAARRHRFGDYGA